MKSKLIRLFAVVASVLVLAVSLVVPMSADSFDSSKPLVERDWTYCTVITFSDLQGCDLTFSYENLCYSIFSINGDRYSIMGSHCGMFSGEYYAFGRIDPSGSSLPFLWYKYNVGELFLEDSNDVIIVDRRYNPDSEFKIIVYSNTAISYTGNYGFEIVTYEVEPATNRITSVFTNIMDWITSGLNSVQGVFYVNNQLTMLGTLAVIGVAVGVAFLIIGVVQKFLS